MGMIFVPSVGGISHSPRELTNWVDCARGAKDTKEPNDATDPKDPKDANGNGNKGQGAGNGSSPGHGHGKPDNAAQGQEQ